MTRPIGVIAAAIQVALGGFVGYNFIHQPHQASLRAVDKEIEEARKTHQSQSDVAALLAQVERYRTRLAPQPDSSWLAREVVALSEQAGVKLTTIMQEAPRQVDPFTRLAIDVSFTATYHQLGAFLDLVEHAPRFIRADQLQIGASPQARGPVPIHLVLSTLYLPALAGAP